MKRVTFEVLQLGGLATKCSPVNYNCSLNVLYSRCKPQLLLGFQKCGYFTQKEKFYSTKPELLSKTKTPSQEEPVQDDNNKVVPSTPESKEVSTSPGEYVELHPEVAAREMFYRHKKQILKLEEDDPELENTSLMTTKKLSLLEVREGEASQGLFSTILKPPADMNMTDTLAWWQQDIDLRPESIRRYLRTRKEKKEIRLQRYNAARHAVLGHDLAAAHFVAFRGGKVKFLGYDRWIDHYRTEQDDDDQVDLPANVSDDDLFILPTKYDPNFIVSGLDLSNITSLRFEGLQNLDNLKHCTVLKFENCVHLDAWCIDRLASYFEEHLEYLDLSGCSSLTEGSLCAIARFRKLKTLVLKNINHITNKDVVCAWLEETNPDLTIIGTNYEQRLHEIKLENERLSKKALEEEAMTITVESPHGGGPDLRISDGSDLAASSNKQ